MYEVLDQAGAAGHGCATDEQSPARLPARGAGPIVVYVQLRPRWAVISKAMTALDALIEAHPDVVVSVCGLSRDPRYLRVTLSIGLGPTATIARFSAEATAAYTFVGEVFARLFDHAPCYVGEPTAEERTAAAAVSASAPGQTRVAGRSQTLIRTRGQAVKAGGSR